MNVPLDMIVYSKDGKDYLLMSNSRHGLIKVKLEGIDSIAPITARIKGTAGLSVYTGPCTPPGAPHHYTFVLIATDLDTTALPPGLTRLELLEKLNGHVKGATGLVGLFKNPL